MFDKALITPLPLAEVFKRSIVRLFPDFVENLFLFQEYNISTFQKNRYFELIFLASQRYTHPPINAHMMLSVRRIDM